MIDGLQQARHVGIQRSGGLILALLVIGGASSSVARAQEPPAGPGSYTIEQTLSDQAQLNTIAFDALGFLTGTLGSDSFFPPGKVADFWGFQSLRDNDPSQMGHNTDFLTKAALNTLAILTPEQRARLRALAASQVDDINSYAYERFALMSGFRRLLTGDLPPASTGLNEDAVAAYSAQLYRLDGAMSVERAMVFGPILTSLTPAQRASLDAMVGTGMSSWPDAAEPADLRGLDHDTKVAVMTYGADLFSWYAGSLEKDVYFCPERQGTYFGSFYLKDAPAVGNPGYSIGTNITGDMGKELLAVLTPRQAAIITDLVSKQRGTLADIVQTRRQVALQLRSYLNGGTADAQTVQELMSRYGADDGRISAAYATAFAAVNATLTTEQRNELMTLRTKTVGSFTPAPAYLYATPIPAPTVRDTDFLFTSQADVSQVPAIGMVSSRTTIPKGVTITVTIRTRHAPAGSVVTLRGTVPGHRTEILRRLPSPVESVYRVQLTPSRTVRLRADLLSGDSKTIAHTSAITITVHES